MANSRNRESIMIVPVESGHAEIAKSNAEGAGGSSKDSVNGKVNDVDHEDKESSHSRDSSIILISRDEWLALQPANRASTANYSITDIDDRLSYRQGWPLLPTLPVLTARSEIPKSSTRHVNKFREILDEHKIKIHGLEVAHRHNSSTPIDKSTLTLCVLSDEEANAEWPAAILALRSFIQSHGLTLAIEFIDHRIFQGIYTLPILPTETALTAEIKKKRNKLARILNESGLPWTSLEFFWRGMGTARKECMPTVLIGTRAPQRMAWWGELRETIVNKMSRKEKWVVEVCFRDVVKY